MDTSLYLDQLEKQLVENNKIVQVELNREWSKQFPLGAGVYLIRENDAICYVGETGSLRARMGDLLQTRNHVIRRNIGKVNFCSHQMFEKPSSKKMFHPEIEQLLEQWMCGKLTVCCLEVNLGRKELEELLFEKHKPKYNIKGKRKGRMTWNETIQDWTLD